MKILDVEQIRATDQHTIKNEPIQSVDLMERAAGAFTAWFTRQFGADRPVKIFCGTGNNGGDGLVIGRLLRHKGYQVHIYAVRISSNASPDFRVNEKRFKNLDQAGWTDLEDAKKPPAIWENDIVIEAIFGSGLNRPIKGFATDIIEHINKNNPTGIAVDVPAGIFSDQHSTSVKFKADYTVSFQLPKLAFFFPENAPFVGHWTTVPIGLDQAFIDQQNTDHYYLTAADVRPLVKRRSKFAYKNQYGHALLYTGSCGKMGASVLASRACLRVGCGLVTTHIPRCGYDILQSAVPEAMVSTDDHEQILNTLPDLQPFDHIGVGPGIGTAPPTQEAFQKLLSQSNSPMVIDADGLNILAENKDWLDLLPGKSILTPHPGEFKRLVGTAQNDFEALEQQRKFAHKHNVFVILKRAHTVIVSSDGNAYFNSTGNPGMATAGSGDVLTGMLTGLLNQGYSPLDTCLLGVYLHGSAGDGAAYEKTIYSLTAGDIIDHIGNAYAELSIK